MSGPCRRHRTVQQCHPTNPVVGVPNFGAVIARDSDDEASWVTQLELPVKCRLDGSDCELGKRRKVQQGGVLRGLRRWPSRSMQPS